MMKAPAEWRVVPGDEWQESLEGIDPSDEFFARNVRSVYDTLSFDPYSWSRAFTDHNTRLFTTKDVAAGYRLVALIHIDPGSHTVTLGWADIEWLPEHP